MVSATILKASGLPEYACTRRARSSGEPMTSCSVSRYSQAAASNPARRKARTGVRLPSRARSSAGFSRLVNSRQLWCAVWATCRSRRPYASKPGRRCPLTSPSESRLSRLSSTSSTREVRSSSSRRLRRRSRLWGAWARDSGASTCRQPSSGASQAGASRSERKITTWKWSANLCMALVTSADLPMPPRPNTLTTRQRSCTIQRERVASSCSRP